MQVQFSMPSAKYLVLEDFILENFLLTLPFNLSILFIWAKLRYFELGQKLYEQDRVASPARGSYFRIKKCFFQNFFQAKNSIFQDFAGFHRCVRFRKPQFSKIFQDAWNRNLAGFLTRKESSNI